MSITNSQEITNGYKQMLKKYNSKKGDICFTWIYHIKRMMLFNMGELLTQIKDWRKQKVTALECNNREINVDGKMWYIFVVQPCDCDYEPIKPILSYPSAYTFINKVMNTPLCPLSLMLFGLMVSGYTYAFDNKAQRDTYFALLTGNDNDELTIEMVRTKKRILEISLYDGTIPVITEQERQQITDELTQEKVIEKPKVKVDKKTDERQQTKNANKEKHRKEQERKEYLKRCADTQAELERKKKQKKNIKKVC